MIRNLKGATYSRVRLSPGRTGKRKDIPLGRIDHTPHVELDRRLSYVADQLRDADQPVPIIERLLEETLKARDARSWKGIEKAVKAIVEGRTAAQGKGSMTFAAFAEEYLSGDLALRFPDRVDAREAKTVANDRSRLERYVLPLIGDFPLSSIELEHVDDVMSKVPIRYESGKEMTSANRRHIAQVIRRMLSLAAYPCRYIPASPIPRGWLPKIKSTPRFPFLYPDEDARLLACTDIPIVSRLLYGFLAREGTRGPSEALAIQIHRVDLEHGTYALGDNKTDDARGWVLGEDVQRALRIWIERLHPTGKDRSALLFLDPVSKRPPEDGGHLAAKFRGHLQQAGVDRSELFETSGLRRPIRAHDLRATFITLALANGRSETWVTDRTGHTTSGQLMNYRRAARTVAEARMVQLAPLDQAIPELAASGGGNVGGGSGKASRPVAIDRKSSRDVTSRNRRASLGSAAARRMGSTPFPCTFEDLEDLPDTENDVLSPHFPPPFRDLSREVREAIADGDEARAWEAAQALARCVLETEAVALAKAVLDAGPFALRRAIELAEVLSGPDPAKAIKRPV